MRTSKLALALLLLPAAARSELVLRVPGTANDAKPQTSVWETVEKDAVWLSAGVTTNGPATGGLVGIAYRPVGRWSGWEAAFDGGIRKMTGHGTAPNGVFPFVPTTYPARSNVNEYRGRLSVVGTLPFTKFVLMNPNSELKNWALRGGFGLGYYVHVAHFSQDGAATTGDMTQRRWHPSLLFGGARRLGSRGEVQLMIDDVLTSSTAGHFGSEYGGVGFVLSLAYRL